MVAQGITERGLERVRQAEEQVEKLEQMLREADRRASSIGTIVGRVSRFGEVKVGEQSRIEFTIDPATYYGNPEAPFHRVGDYLVIVDPKDLREILVRVVEINRRDELAIMGVQPPVSPMVDGVEPRGLITSTVVQGELVLELGPGDESPRPAVKSVEPQAPVVAPSAEELKRLLDLPASGVVLGSLATPGGLVAGGGIPVMLPLKALLHHVLIVGTTGSGKTTLLKNVAASAYSQLEGDERFVALIMDLNEDFVQLPIPPDFQPTPREILEGAYKGVRPPEGIAVTVPLTSHYLADLWTSLVDEARWSSDGQAAEVMLHEVLREMAEDYIEKVISPLLPEQEMKEVKVRSTVLDDGLNVLEAQGLPFRLSLVPYAIDTTAMTNESLVNLMPGLTELARNTLSSLRKRFYRDHSAYPPLEVIEAALLITIMKSNDRVRSRSSDESNEEEEAVMQMAWELMEDHIVNVPQYLEKYRPQRQRRARGQGSNLEEAHVWDKPLPGASDMTLMDAVNTVSDMVLRLMPHRGTLEALYRRLSLLLETGFVDILYVNDKGLHVVQEPQWPSIVSYSERLRVPVVVDLRWGVERSFGGPEALRVIAYRTLESLMSWKQDAWSRRERTPNVVIFIDEAHQFFPSEGKSRDEAEEVRQVSAMLSKVARLGRARGLGLVFSTHMPSDLNSLIIQLTNTKVVLRSEESQLEAISLPQQVKSYVPRLQDRYMVVLSFVLREGYVLAVTTTPLTKHFDISASGR